ncbi:hypothetical protein XBFFL1_1840001 [Xenorhabdus bovienii str. feltiae Florida]|nr:hypothetical protein XBFFL1_1840001 [Xenorhabdus bovienii str. feltiae Florida]
MLRVFFTQRLDLFLSYVTIYS